MSKQYKVFNFDVKQEGPEEDRVLRFVGSDETPDRDNDIIEVAGWKLTDYMKNPVFLWAHNYDELPIGKTINVAVDVAAKKLLFDVKFPSAETYPFADTVYKLYREGFLSATSVGFRGLKSKTRDEEEMMNLPEWQRGRRYMEQELLELSAVPVPCNPNALIAIRSKGFTDEEVNQVFVEEKSVIPYKKFPLADEGATWDGPAEIAASSVDDLKIMCAWYDSENADVKQAYKLPHHLQDSKNTVWRAVAAAMGALLGARGGVQIPEGDRRGVYNHLSKHYTDFDKEAPDFKEYTDAELKAMFPEEEKTGATLSARNREILNSVHDSIESCRKQLRTMLDETAQMDSACASVSAETLTVKVELSDELKNAFAEIKSLINQNAASKDIDLDAIELPSPEKDPASIELNIEPGELKTMISEIVNDQLRQGGLS